jgi:lipopolysaccharide/colanic/teichoic acid biosynthesis glycosyltransferase
MNTSRHCLVGSIGGGVEDSSAPKGVCLTKRCFDLALAFFAFLVAALPMALIALLIRLFAGAPVFFLQTRPGLRGKPFKLCKFRTMTHVFDGRGKSLSDEDRMTRIGRSLRSTSLDELPELYNVFRGDMSIVGPRPLLMRYLDRYTPQQARRHEVKPGLTGWAQVNGRNAISWEDKFRLDVWYVDNWSVSLDLKIVAMTVMKVLKREGISQDGQATMEEFMG